MAMNGRMGGMTVHEKSKRGIVGILKELFAYSKKIRLPVAIALLLAVGGAILTIIGPDKISEMVDIISDSLYGEIDMKGVAGVGITLIILFVCGALLTYIEHYIMATVTLDLSNNLRKDLSKKINRLPIKAFGSSSNGDILSRITNDVSTLQQALSNSLPSIISAVAQLVGCLIMMYVTEWRLASAAVLVTLLGFALMALIMSHSQKYFINRQKSLGVLNGYVEEMYSGHDVVRISRGDRKIKKNFKGMNRDVYEANWKSQFLSGVMQPLMMVIGNLGYVAVCVLGSIFAIDGSIKFSVIIAFIMYVRLFTSPLSTLAQGMTNMQTAAASGDRVFDFLQEKEMTDESNKPSVPENLSGEVEFRHVRFSYPDNPDKIIIKDFSAKIAPGQKVAIVGPTGAGKTTMVNLLMRFYELSDGEILIDGTPITNWNRSSVHSLFGMVLQDTWLFEGTVRDNLVYNKQNVDDETLKSACKACGILRFIEALPHGFDTILDDSVVISAGQKQLFTIARAMIQNSPMLILDEATSSVDTRTELITQKAMDSLTKQRTSFVIAHRLSTIKNADLILVMKDGDIIEHGNHEELMVKNGFYAELYNSQFEQAS